MKMKKGGRGLRVLATVGALALGLAGVAAMAAPANAASPTVPNLPSGPYTLNITKYAQPNPPLDLGNDGTQQNIPSSVKPLAGVVYTVAPVNGVDLTTAAGWQLTEGMKVSSTGVVTDANNNVYTVGAATTLPATNAAGATTFTDNGNPAVYVVTETSAGGNNVPNLAPPFLVTLPLPQANNWLTTVWVYPKNVTAQAPTKTVDDSGSFGLGQSVNWTLSATVPNVPAETNLTSFILKDALDTRLTPPTAASVNVTFKNASNATVAIPAGSYTTTVTGQNLAVTFTSSGLAWLSQSAQQGGTVTAAFATVVNSVGTGTIENTPVVNVNGHDYTGSPVQTTWGSLNLKKVGGTADGAALSGAVFKVYTSQADAKAGTNPVSVNGQTTFTSDSNGNVAIAGLKSQTDGAGANLTYYIVETQAPTGYNIATGYDAASGGHAVTVYPGSTANATITVVDPQVPPFVLPLTGSTGTTLFVGGGIALIAIAMGAGIVAYRRKQHALADQQ